MKLRLIPAEQMDENRLKQVHVAPSQIHFIETVQECLDDASANREWHPCGIFDQDLLVGFLMIGYISSEKRLWFDRFMIDQRYQHRGYGKTTFRYVLDECFRHEDVQEVYLSLYEDNQVAWKMYESFGFRINGELDTKGEKIMVLTRNDFCLNNYNS